MNRSERKVAEKKAHARHQNNLRAARAARVRGQQDEHELYTSIALEQKQHDLEERQARLANRARDDRIIRVEPRRGREE